MKQSRTSGKRRRRSRENESGVVIVTVIIITVPILIIAGSMLATVVSHSNEAKLRQGQFSAKAVSSSGVQDGLARREIVPTYQGTYRVDINGGSAVVTITDWDKDGLDNDNNGAIDDAEESSLTSIRSTGWMNAMLDDDHNLVGREGVTPYRSVTDVVLRREIINLKVEQAIYIDDPLSELDLSGNAFLISGDDTNIDGTPGPAGTFPGLGTPGDPADLIDQVANNQHDNILGKGGEPSIIQVSEVDIDGVLSALTSAADTHWTENHTVSGNSVLGTPDDPMIIYAEKDVTITGNTKGAGIMLVEGDLKMTGNIAYAGLILVTGSVSISGGGHSKNIWGGLMALGSLEAEVGINGSVEIKYSSEALEVVSSISSSSLDIDSVVSWVQH